MTSYDYYITVQAPAAWDRGWKAGILEPYLSEAPYCSFDEPAESYWQRGYEQGVIEREEYSAEELFVWAWYEEHDISETFVFGPALAMSMAKYG